MVWGKLPSFTVWVVSLSEFVQNSWKNLVFAMQAHSWWVTWGSQSPRIAYYFDWFAATTPCGQMIYLGAISRLPALATTYGSGMYAQSARSVCRGRR